MAPKTLILLCLSTLLISAPLVAGPVLHERFGPDPAEDLRLGATTPSGKMPAAIRTRSGMVLAPDEAQTADEGSQGVYGGSQTPTSADANYHIDRHTTRPDRVEYDEPFRPSILPFKRSYAFDRLREDLSFGVAKPELSVVPVGGTADRNEDVFFADLEVDLIADVPVRIPTVGPGARLRAFHLDPRVKVEILRDGADNWFARAERGGRARLVMQISIAQQVFGSQFLPVSWSALRPHVSPLPKDIRAVAAQVVAHIGVDRHAQPAGALMTLVRYFRQFRESNELPVATNNAALYRELSLTQKGVCRHRAYAFTITAQSLGLPTRLVHNEAHAWVEVYDTSIWHRIDLGGAASHIDETRPDPLLPEHRPPSDPFSWPRESRPAHAVVAPPAHDASGAGDSAAADQDSPDSAHPAHPEEPDGGWPGASQVTTSAPLSPQVEVEAEVLLKLGESRILRGRPLSVSGSARRAGRVCALSRVDILLSDTGGESWSNIGSVATDREGNFEGQVTLPSATQVGSLQVSARLGGGCR